MLELRLLGQFGPQLDGRVLDIPSRPAQSLLAFLVLNAGILHRRELLSGILWDVASRQTIYRLAARGPGV